MWYYFYAIIINPQYVSDLYRTSDRDSKRIAIDYLQRTKHALIIFIQSAVESYYRALCSTLFINTPYSFNRVVDVLFNKFMISTDSDWYKANIILAKVRNTLHNNGIHTNPDETISYHKKQYNFSQNLPHHAAGYDTIIHIISDLIEFLYNIGKESSNERLIDNNGCVDYSIVI